MNHLAKRMLAGILCAGMMLSATAMASAEPVASPSSSVSAGNSGITVFGNAKSQVKPDTVYLVLGYRNKNSNVSKAIEASSKKMNTILKAIEAAGIKEADIQTSGISIYQSYDYAHMEYAPLPSATPATGADVVAPPAADPETIYQVENSLTITLRDVDKMSGVVNAAFQAGANYINNINFDATSSAGSYDQLLAKATKDAMRRAKVLADASDQKLGKLVNVTEMSSNYNLGYGSMYGPSYGGYYSIDLSMLEGKAQQSSAAIELGNTLKAGTLTISAQVMITYAAQ